MNCIVCSNPERCEKEGCPFEGCWPTEMHKTKERLRKRAIASMEEALNTILDSIRRFGV